MTQLIETVVAVRSNSELIAHTAPLWLQPTDRVLDITYGGRRHVIESAEAGGLRHAYDFIHYSGTGPQPKHDRQVHPRAAHSFLCVFTQPARRRRVHS